MSGQSQKKKSSPDSSFPKQQDKWLWFTLYYVLLVGKVIGVLPLSGSIWHYNYQQLHFRWFSLITSYCLLVVFNSFCYSVQAIWYEMASTMTYTSTDTTIYYLFALLSIINCFRISYQLSNLLQQWNKIVSSFRQFMKQTIGCNETDLLSTSFVSNVLLTVLLSSLGMVETWLYDNAIGYNNDENCIKHNSMQYCNLHFLYPSFENAFGSNAFVTNVVFFSHFWANYVYDFRDLFLVALVLTLRQHFSMVATFLKRHHRKIRTGEQWGILRQNHRNLCRLLRTIDDTFFILVLLSYGSNTYGLLSGFYFSISSLKNDFTRFISGFATVMLCLVRVTALTFAAAGIKKEQAKILKYLLIHQSDNNQKELDRFIMNVQNTHCSLSCGHLFYISRKTILTIASTIFTYELILIINVNVR